jgi:hypothetical protein
VGAGGTESEGFEGKTNELMPTVWKSTNVTLDSNYGFEAFMTKDSDPKPDDAQPDTDINVFLISNSVVSRRKFTFMRNEKSASEEIAKREKIMKICRRCFTLPGSEQKKVWYERKDDKKQTFSG